MINRVHLVKLTPGELKAVLAALELEAPKSNFWTAEMIRDLGNARTALSLAVAVAVGNTAE